jgi:hypothetical protein
MHEFRYIPTERMTFAALPAGVRWVYVEAPPSMAKDMWGLPRSEHEFGVIATSRLLGHHEFNRAKLTPITLCPRGSHHRYPAAAPPDIIDGVEPPSIQILERGA